MLFNRKGKNKTFPLKPSLEQAQQLCHVLYVHLGFKATVLPTGSYSLAGLPLLRCMIACESTPVTLLPLQDTSCSSNMQCIMK